MWDVYTLQAYKHRILEDHSYRIPSTSVFDPVWIAEEKVMIKDHDDHHNTMSRLANFAKIN